MLRSIVIVSTGTLASRLTGFLRDAILAALLGVGAAADAFLVAFQLVTLIRRLLTEGALNAAFVPAWLRIRKNGEAEAAAFAGRALGTIGVLVAQLALTLAFAAPIVISLLAPGFEGKDTLASAVTYARLMLPYLAFAGPVAVLMALANARRRVAFSSGAPVLFNAVLMVVIAVLLFGAADSKDAAWIVAASVGVAGLLQLAMLAGSRDGASPLRVSFDKEMRVLLGRAVPGMIASAGPQMLIVGGAIVASHAPSGVAYLYFASRLIDLPLGMVSTISGAVLVTAASHVEHDNGAARAAQAHAVGIALALALPASVGLFILAEPIVEAVFARGAFTAIDARETAQVMAMLALGLPAQALAKALSPSFYARGDTSTPMVAALAAVAVALVAALAARDVTGIAAAISLGSAVAASVLLVRGENLLWGDARLIPIALATMAMGAALIAAKFCLPPAGVITLMPLIACGLAVYIAALLVLGALNPTEIKTLWSQRDLRKETSHGTDAPTARGQDLSK